MHRNLALPAVVALVAVSLSGCVYDEDADLKVAFTYRMTDLLLDKDPRRLSEWLAAHADTTATIYQVDDSGAALQALRSGQADVAFVDGTAGWLGWQRLGLDVIAADQKADGRTHYDAAAWVRADSPYQTMADLKGADSCHTGRLKSAGMFMPVGHLLDVGLVDAGSYADDIGSVEQIVEDYFGETTIGGAYGSYDGALRCLSEGVGDVAFVRDTTPDDYCGADARSWCLPREDYRLLQVLGPVPAHPVMVSPHLDAEKRQRVLDALLALNDSDEGQAILKEVLETPGITQVTAEEHLGDYGERLSLLPGFDAYFGGKYGA